MVAANADAKRLAHAVVTSAALDEISVTDSPA